MGQVDKKAVKQAEMLISGAMCHIHNVSTSGIGFDLSKPLNILYKELDTHRQLLLVYLGDKPPVYDGDATEPQSWQAYRNLNC